MFSTVSHLFLYSLTVKFLHHFFIMLVGFNLNLTYGLKPHPVASKLSLFIGDPFSKLRVTTCIPQGQHHVSSGLLNKVKPCSAEFVPGCVTKYGKYPVLNELLFFFIPIRRRYLRLQNSQPYVMLFLLFLSTICSSFPYVRIHVYLFTASYK